MLKLRDYSKFAKDFDTTTFEVLHCERHFFSKNY